MGRVVPTQRVMVHGSKLVAQEVELAMLRVEEIAGEKAKSGAVRDGRATLKIVMQMAFVKERMGALPETWEES